MLRIQSPEKLLDKIKSHFDKTDKTIFITTIITGIITNFYFFISRGVAPDALTNVPTHYSNAWEISLGRFGLQFFDNFRFGLVNQVLTVSIALLFISLFLILIRKTFKIESKILLVLLAIIFAAAPQFTETYEFLYCADAYIVALFFSAVATWALTKIDRIKNSKKYILLAIISIIIICSIYQAYLGVLLGLIVAYSLKTTLDEKSKNAIKFIIKSMIFVFISICAYYVLFRITCKLAGTRPSGYKGANNLGLSTILALPKTIASTFEDFYNFFFKEKIINNAFYNRIVAYIILLVIFILSLFTFFKKEQKGRVSKIITTIVLLAIFPIAISIMNLIAPGTRIFLVTGPGILVTAIIFAIVIDKLSPSNFNNIMRYVSYAALFFLGWTFILSDIRTYIVRENQVIQFEQVARTVYEKAVSLPDYKKGMKFVFNDNIHVEAKDYKMTNGSVTSCGISWEAYYGTTRYGYFYEQYLGIKNIEFADSETYTKVINTDEFRSMDVYGEGSEYVKIIDDVVVVKVSDKTFLNEKGEFISW